MAVREGDPLSTGHGCDSVTTLALSLVRTTRANSIFCAVQGTITVTHLVPPNVPPCPSHAAGIASGSSTVKVNGKGCGRVGDSISGCTSVAAGSSNVFAGG